MPTTRTRRRRQTKHKPILQQLLDGEPIERSEEARQELLDIWFFGWSDYPDLPKLPSLAYSELQEWEN